MLACPPEEALGAFAEGRLPVADRAAIEGHLDGCGGCGQRLAHVLSRSSLLDRGAGGLTMPTVPLKGFGPARAAGEHFGRYVILAGAGTGGMGAVYAAFDTALERKVALKFLARSGSDASLGLLLAEASMMAKLNHPNVVTVYDAGVIDETPFIAMELVEGQTLSAWAETPRSVREIVTAMAGVARGLAAAHACGIVHRDVKPGNVLIDGERALVTDFGISVHKNAREDDASGTPGFMAPEQWRGDPVDARTDVFGFCATLYRLLYGVMPFAGDNLAALAQAVRSWQRSSSGWRRHERASSPPTSPRRARTRQRRSLPHASWATNRCSRKR
jgi:serine/threonine protein kinase